MGRHKKEKRRIMDGADRLADTDILADFPWARGLTYRQACYVIAYEGDNASACEKIGVPPSCGEQWQTDNRMRYALKQRLLYGVAPQLCAGREERQAFWSALMRDGKSDPKVRVRASELLGKSQADFVEPRNAAAGAGGSQTLQIVVHTGVPQPDPDLFDGADGDGADGAGKWVDSSLADAKRQPTAPIADADGADEADDDDY